MRYTAPDLFSRPKPDPHPWIFSAIFSCFARLSPLGKVYQVIVLLADTYRLWTIHKQKNNKFHEQNTEQLPFGGVQGTCLLIVDTNERANHVDLDPEHSTRKSRDEDQ